MRKTLLAASATIAVASLSACGGGTDAATPGTTVTDGDLVASTPKPSGPATEVKWMLQSEPVTLDADLDAGNNEDAVIANVCERLYEQQPDFTVKPRLVAQATRPDRTTIVYRLRDDVTFHDGSAMTAQDVAWSMDRHRKAGADESDEYDRVRSVAATGEHEVTVRLKAPDAQFDMRMAGDAGIVWNPRVVRAQGDDFGSPKSPDACSGPYRLQSWKAGSSLTLEQAPDYWDAARAAKTKRVTFTWADGAALVNAVNSGDVDGTYLKDPSLLGPLASNDRLKVSYGATTTSWQLFPTDKGPLRDPKVRTALSLALDREGIAKAAFAGRATPWRLPVGSGAWGYAKASFQAAYDRVTVAPAKPSAADLERAKRLVAEAGVRGPVIVASNGTPTNTVIANAVRSAGQQIGLDVRSVTLSSSQFGDLYSEESARRKVDLFADDWFLSKADPLGMYDNVLSDSVNNYAGFRDAAYDRTYQQAAGEYDDEARARLAIRLQDAYLESMVTIPLVMAPNALVLSTKLTGAPPSVTYLSTPWAAELGAS